MMTTQQRDASESDPLGLARLPMLTPDEDGWPAIEAALVAERESSQRRHKLAGWLAAAASLVLVVSVVMRLPGPDRTGEPAAAEPAVATSRSVPQRLPHRVKTPRRHFASQPPVPRRLHPVRKPLRN